MVALPSTPIRSGGKEQRTPESVIEVDGLSFALHKSGRRRTLQITVERAGDLAILAPVGASHLEIIDFVQEKLLWVHTKISEKERLQRRAPIKEFVDGEGFLYLGKSYRLRIVDQQLADISLSAGRFLLRSNRMPRARETFVTWYSRNALRWFNLKVAEYARRMNVQIAEVRIQDLGFRWGSYSPDGRVQFHWKAILLPPRIVEYIVAHELAHAEHPNHSPNFWDKIAQHMPDWQQRKSWLAEHGIEVEGL